MTKIEFERVTTGYFNVLKDGKPSFFKILKKESGSYFIQTPTGDLLFCGSLKIAKDNVRIMLGS